MIENLVENEHGKSASKLLCVMDSCYVNKFKKIADCLVEMNVDPIFFTKAYPSLNCGEFDFVFKNSGDEYDAFLVQWLYKKLGENAKIFCPEKKVVWFTDAIFKNEPAYSAKLIVNKISYDIRSYRESPVIKDFTADSLAKAVH